MKTFLQIFKLILKAFLVWVGLTIIALVIDSSFRLSEKSDVFTLLFVAIPLIVAVCGPSRKLILWAWKYEKSKQKKLPKQAKRPIEKPASSAPKTVPPTSPKPAPQHVGYTMARIDKMEGHEFERFTADLLRKLGYERVEVTPSSGDQGVDVIAVKGGERYAIQCKRYSQKLGNKPVQEVFAGKTIYGCSVAVVLTNNYFTEGAKEAAKATGVELWDRDTLRRMLDYSNYKAIV